MADLTPAEVPALAAAFGRRLHEGGVPSTPERSVRFARALQVAPPATRSELYWTARAVFVSAREQIGAFDALFAQVFDGAVDPADSRGDTTTPNTEGAERGEGRPRPGATAVEAPPRARGSVATAPAREDRDGQEREVPFPVASDQERLAEKDFAALEADELLALRALMRDLEVATPVRRTRRARRARRGERLDVRATLRAGHRTGGDPVRLVRRARVTRHRPLVVLCDISGSMESYARAYLQFLQAAVGGADAEAFVFATRLTRLTRALRGRQPDLAIARASAAAPDWSGGTQIGRALQRFNGRHGRRGMARGAVVVIVSDGWDRGDPALLAREMERLGRLAHRIVWVNPRKAAPGFTPAVGGMAAALPHCDAFVGGNSLAGLGEVIEQIGAR